MSACISRHGEYSEHVPSETPLMRFLCTRCFVFDETAAMSAIAEAEAERDRLRDGITALADDWQWGAWADTPRHADRVADRIGAAQYVTDWLRTRVRALLGQP